MGIRKGYGNRESGLMNPDIPFAHTSDISMEQIGMKQASRSELSKKASRGYSTLVSGRPESPVSYQVVQRAAENPWTPARLRTEEDNDG